MASEKELKAYEKELRAYEEKLLDAQKGIEAEKRQVSQYASQTYGQGDKQNLVEWELDFKPELDDIARSLRCDYLKIDERGNQFWTRNPDQKKIFLNELGVNDVLRKIILLVNKNKVLSNYTPEEIKSRVKQIGHEIRALIYNNYEAYGIDNEYKMNNYPGIVMDVLDIIEGAYRRAMKGETHKGLSEQRLVTQNDSINNGRQQIMAAQKTPKWYSPGTWGA
jgi:hypothetical protein